ncbi:hypothetical protein [Spongiivirga citrea]|uniref:Cytochrome c domain-containing protein n=1 Tax=Spongiivirga citrea TaxID=1481457 RepID=A0A6M0CQX7_9FLAO|nr:hypothetical protein [Spongiivirga citrea]NER18474.1 hypothetical protein [Spongiivirga citrea]
MNPKRFLNRLVTLSLIASTVFLYNCNKDDDNPEEMQEGETPTFTADIQGIMAGNCTGCHASTPTNGAPMSLVTYNQVVDAVNNRNLVSRINSTTAPMPQTGRMNATLRQTIEDWVNAGMPEN